MHKARDAMLKVAVAIPHVRTCTPIPLTALTSVDPLHVVQLQYHGVRSMSSNAASRLFFSASNAMRACSQM